MERAGIRIVIVGLGLLAALLSVVLFAAAVMLIERPAQRVGVHLEFAADHGDDEDFIAGERRSLPRLLESAGALDVKVKDVDAATLEITFDPPQAWSEAHGLRADGDEHAPELVPDGLRTLLTTARDVRLLEVVDMPVGSDVERDRTARLLDHHPERALDALRTALHDARERGHVVAWVPRAAGASELVPVLVEGSQARQITIQDLASASRGSRAADIELAFDDARRRTLELYLGEIAGRRIAFVVDGAIEGVGKAGVYRNYRLGIAGENDELSDETCAAILAYVREPRSPRAPRITRSWIEPTNAIAGAVVAIVGGAVSVLFGAAMVWALVRDLRRPPTRKTDADWSSAA